MSIQPPTDPSSVILHPSPIPYDALLLVSFGGPEKPDDVMPFLENVVRGKRVPRERLLEIAARYGLFGGMSPANEQNRALLRALVAELNARGPRLAVYWGNRNWHPLLADTVREMADDGVRRALAFVTSPFGSYPGCRQYLEDIQRAREAVGKEAPQIDKLRLFYNHPGFIEPMAERARAALDAIPAERRGVARLVFSAHSLPLDMARQSPYRQQLDEACRLVAERIGRAEWDLVFQSRSVAGKGDRHLLPERPEGCSAQKVPVTFSGPGGQPWLEPDLQDHLRRLHEEGSVRDVVLVPIGFISEHMEVVYDLDVEAAGLCEELGIHMVRAGVVGTHPRFVAMIRELVCERIEEQPTRLALGTLGPSPDVCPADCCLTRPSP
jgi:ferrochelatase